MRAKAVLGAFFAVAICVAAACSDSARNALTGPSPAVGAPSSAGVSADVRTVTGSAEVEPMPGLVYRNTIDGKKYPDGTVSGNMTAQISDLSAFGLDEQLTIVHEIDCLEFSEDSVWFGATVRSMSKNLPVVPGEEKTIGQIKKVNGQDYLFSGPAHSFVPPGTTCADRPNLPIAPARQGQFSIR